MFAKLSTAKTIMVGPVLDADGVAVTDGIVADFLISKNGAAPAALNGSATLTHRHTGHYSLALTASDLDTIGTAQITLSDTVNSCAEKDLTVMAAPIYDILYGADNTAGAYAWLGIIDQGVAQSATGTTLVLRSAAGFSNDVINGATIVITGGSTGVGQRRVITDYVQSSKTATVDTWDETPTGTITYTIYATPPPPITGTLPSVNMSQIGGSTQAATSLSGAAMCISYGTVSTGATTTSIPASALYPSLTGDDPFQFIGLVMKFRTDTATTGLRGEGRGITGYNDSTNTFTTDPFSSAPASGDLFVIN